MLQEKKKNTDKVPKHTDSVKEVFSVIILNNFFFLLKDYFLKVKWKYLSYLFSSLKNISNSIETKLSSVSDFNFFWGKFYLFTMPLLYNSVQLFRQRPQHHCGLAPVFLNLSLYTSSFVLGQEIFNSRYSFSKQLWFLNNKK